MRNTALRASSADLDHFHRQYSGHGDKSGARRPPVSVGWVRIRVLRVIPPVPGGAYSREMRKGGLTRSAHECLERVTTWKSIERGNPQNTMKLSQPPVGPADLVHTRKPPIMARSFRVWSRIAVNVNR